MTLPPNGEGTNKPEDDPLGGMDPMAWLESLARRQGANPEELITAADLDVPLPSAEQPAERPRPQASNEPPAPEPALSNADDPLGGMDPMAWLESLARRQGANPEELITAADLDVPLPSAELPVESPRPQASTEPSAPEPVLSSADDPLGGMDPMAWLESLARRQGANPEELITAADLDVPLPSAEAEITAPGYTDFDPFSAGTLSASARAVEPSVQQESAVPADDPMAWLETLSSGQAADDPMAWLASLGEPSIDAIGEVSAEPPIVESMTPDEALAWLDSLSAEPEPAQTISPIEAGGLSDDPREVQAWLTEQLGSLMQTRDAETEDVLSDVPPAEPATSLPDWLSEAVVDPTLPAARATLELEIKLPTPPEDLPTWLIEEPAADLDLEFGEDFIPPQSPLPQVPEASLDLDPQEIERMIKPSSPEEVDDLAEYFNEEYDRRLAGDETIPLWYLEALQRAESVIAAPPSAVAAPAPEPELAEPAEPITTSDIPSWLLEMQPEMTAPPATSAALPEELSWLEALAEGLPEETPAAPAEPPIIEPVAIERPDWLAPTGKLDPAVVERHEAERAAAEQAARVAEPPPVRKVEPAIALQQARQQVAQGQLLPALERYQSLVDAMQNLEEVRADLRQLAERHPKEPKVRRLLGDTHMRLGDLQAALDTYLAALLEL